MRISFVEAKKANFNGIPRRNVLMKLPKELGLPSDKLGLQLRCVYGTRDAGAISGKTHTVPSRSLLVSHVESPLPAYSATRRMASHASSMGTTSRRLVTT